MVNPSANGHETLPNGNIRIRLPQDHWAEVRTAGDMRQADVRAILRAADADGIDLRAGLGFDTMAAIQEACVVRMVRRWSLTAEDSPAEPLPVTAETVRNLRVAYYRPLRDAVTPVVNELMGVNDGGEPDPKPGLSSLPPATEAS